MTIIDADAHVLETGRELAPFGWTGPTGHPSIDRLLARDESVLEVSVCDGAQPFAADTRVADMDREGIEISINYPTALLMVNQLPAGAGVGLCRAYNSWAYETFTTKSAGRVRTMALVDISDAPAAVVEARRAVVELGAPGIVVPPHAGNLHLDDPSLDALWALAEELDVAVGVHGGRGTTPPLLPDSSFRDSKRYYAMAHPFGQMLAMGDLVLGGVLERFPRLRVAFLEAGIGWVRWYVDRLDEAAESVNNAGVAWGELSRAPREYVYGGNCFFTCEPDEPGLEDVARTVGVNLVVFSSDYPHFDCSFPQSTQIIQENIRDEQLLGKITEQNPRILYGAGLR